MVDIPAFFEVLQIQNNKSWFQEVIENYLELDLDTFYNAPQINICNLEV